MYGFMHWDMVGCRHGCVYAHTGIPMVVDIYTYMGGWGVAHPRAARERGTIAASVEHSARCHRHDAGR